MQNNKKVVLAAVNRDFYRYISDDYALSYASKKMIAAVKNDGSNLIQCFLLASEVTIIEIMQCHIDPYPRNMRFRKGNIVVDELSGRFITCSRLFFLPPLEYVSMMPQELDFDGTKG